MNYILPHVGQIDTTNLEECYEASIDFNHTEVEIDINFENEKIDTKRLEVAKKFIEDLITYDKQNKLYIEQDFNNEEGDTVKAYLKHHLEEVDEDDLAELIDPNDKSAEPIKKLLNKLHLVHVAIYPDSENHFAIFDYSIGQHLTDYLVVINTNEKGELDYITMES